MKSLQTVARMVRRNPQCNKVKMVFDPNLNYIRVEVRSMEQPVGIIVGGFSPHILKY